MVLTIRYKDGLRERKRTILNVCSIGYVEFSKELHITVINDTGKEAFTIKGEVIELNLISNEKIKQVCAFEIEENAQRCEEMMKGE